MLGSVSGSVLVLLISNNDNFVGKAAAEIELITREFNYIRQVSCVQLVPHTTQPDYIEVVNSPGCWSYLGRVGGRQELSLQRTGCLHPGIPVHEVIHAIGYDHMQNHVERDHFIRIHLENVNSEYHHNFATVDPRWFDNHGTPYDLSSVMHYPRGAFSNNGRDVIVPHDYSYLDVIGSRVMSNGDVQRIRNMYKC